MTVAHRRDWIDAPVDDVADRALRGDTLATWCGVVRAGEGGDLRRVGTVVDVTFPDRRATRGRLRTTRTVRGAVQLDVLVDDRPIGDLWLSVSPWDGGTALEVVADLPASLVARGRITRGLRPTAGRQAELLRRPIAAPGV